MATLDTSTTTREVMTSFTIVDLAENSPLKPESNFDERRTLNVLRAAASIEERANGGEFARLILERAA